MTSATEFYTLHPISAEIVLARLEAARGSLDGVAPEELWPHDQDHYGGLEANAALAERARLAPGIAVVDFCAGLGGPARWQAVRSGVTVTGVELTPARVAGARRLTELVGLADRVRLIEADAARTGLPDRSADAVLSQEAFLHIPDKDAVAREALRLLRPGGRLAFTDWIAHAPLSAADADLMRRGMAVAGLLSLEGWRAVLEGAGFEVLSVEDLTADWAPILRKRLAMFEAMRTEAAARGTPGGHDAFYESYVRFVDLVSAGALGGGRFAARRPDQAP